MTSQGPLDRKTFTLSLSSAQAAAVVVPLAVTVAANVPRIVADPGSLAVGMLRGGQQIVNFTLRDDNRAATAPINLLLPAGAPWIKSLTMLPIPSILPGQTFPVSLQLTPPADLALGDHSGTFVASDGNTFASIPFSFRALSDQMGQLIVRAEDEYTFYAAGNPPLAGATVKVSEALTKQAVGTIVTGTNGVADFGQLREAITTLT